jgi:hypothetical protein
MKYLTIVMKACLIGLIWISWGSAVAGSALVGDDSGITALLIVCGGIVAMLTTAMASEE